MKHPACITLTDSSSLIAAVSDRAVSLASPVGVSTSIRPGRGRSRSKAELDEKVKKPAGDVRKKSPPARKAPSRGRYVDEYARPAC